MHAPMRMILALVLMLVVAAAALAEERAPGLPATASVGFETDVPDKPPSGFIFGRTGKGALGRWRVLRQPDAPSGKHVLAQLDQDPTDYRFPLALFSGPRLCDLGLAVKCKPVAGHVDQACGLIFRAADENNYYITRANALENNVSLYTVKDGRRKIFASWRGKVRSGVWHELSVEAKGDKLTVRFDGQQVIQARNRVFSNAGRVGLWTKADSVTYFDDFTVRPL